MDNKLLISTDGKEYKEIDCSNKPLELEDSIKTAVYKGQFHVFEGTDGRYMFQFDGDPGLVVDTEYEIKL